jgi:pantoate kinase
MARTLQIRDLDEPTIDVLKARARQARMSLSAYVAQQLGELAACPTNAEIVERARELARDGGGASDDEILSVIRDGRDR